MRLRLNFRGEVQGVGFRATAERLARGFPVTGFVRNEPDGSVWLEVQGEVDSLDRFLAALHRSPVGRGIREEQRTLATPATGEDAFVIQRG
jgi:acylphosphatase